MRVRPAFVPPAVRRALLALAVCAFGACGAAGDGEAVVEDAPTTEAEAPSSEARPVVDTDERIVDVELLEYVIGMPTGLTAGPITLRISNQGFELHNLKFFDDEDAMVWETGGDINTGESRVFELELSPGTYRVVCDVAGHDTRGMVATVVVEP